MKKLYSLVLMALCTVSLAQSPQDLNLHLISLYQNGFMENALTYLEQDAILPSMSKVDQYKQTYKTRDWKNQQAAIDTLRKIHPRLYRDCQMIVHSMYEKNDPQTIRHNFEGMNTVSEEAVIFITIFDSKPKAGDPERRQMLADYIFVRAIQDYFLCLYTSQFILIRELSAPQTHFESAVRD